MMFSRRSAIVIGAILTSVVTFSHRDSARASFPGTNGRIAFTESVSTNDGESHLDISSINPDGTGKAHITTELSDEYSAAWSADGTKIAFGLQDRRHGFATGPDIYVMNADGSGQTRVVENAFGPAVWSPSGLELAFVRYGVANDDEDSEIFVANADGSNQRPLTSNAVTDDGPAWSPDGTKIAFTRGQPEGSDVGTDIFVMAPDGSGQTQLTTDTGYDVEPNWSPDGTKIAFSARRTGEKNEIFAMNADGSGQTRLTVRNPAVPTPTPTPDDCETDCLPVVDPKGDFEPVWSPDGAQIAFMSYEDGGGIFVMNAEGTNITRIAAEGFGPDWQSVPTSQPTPTPTPSPMPTPTPTSTPTPMPTPSPTPTLAPTPTPTPNGSPVISIFDKSVNEGDQGTNQCALSVKLSTASTSTVTVSVTTNDGTALAGEDYAQTTGTLTFTPGQKKRKIRVPIFGDRLDEPRRAERFFVNLLNADGAMVGDGQARCVIREELRG